MGYAWQIIGFIVMLTSSNVTEGLILLVGGTILNAVNDAVERIRGK